MPFVKNGKINFNVSDFIAVPSGNIEDKLVVAVARGATQKTEHPKTAN
jgi:hypothetical protein